MPTIKCINIFSRLDLYFPIQNVVLCFVFVVLIQLCTVHVECGLDTVRNVEMLWNVPNVNACI